MKRKKIYILSSLMLLAALPAMAYFYCAGVTNYSCPSSMLINGQHCNLSGGGTYGVVGETEEGEYEWNLYQTFCYHWACSYNCDGTYYYGESSASPTYDCAGSQIGFCN